MAVTITEQTLRGPGQLLLRWSSNLATPTYRIYIDGVLTRTTTMTWAIFPLLEDEYMQIEILDDTSTPQTAYPARMTFWWDRVTNATKYRVEKYVDAAWNTERTILDNGSLVVRYQTPVLDDLTTYQYRVVPVSANGVDGTAREFTFAMVRRPALDDVTTAYVPATGKLTLTAA